VRDDVRNPVAVAEEQINQAASGQKNQPAGSDSRLPRTFYEQRMAGTNRRNAAHERISRAQKCQEQRQGTKNVHYGPPSPIWRPATRVAMTLHRAGFCRIRLPVAAGRGFIFRRAFGLHVLGYKAAVISEAAFDQRLRFVHKRVRQWLAAYIAHGQEFPLTGKHEIDPAGKPLDSARLNRAPHADAMRASCAIEGRQFSDSVIVRLALAIAEPGEKAKRHDDYPDANSEFCVLLHSNSENVG